MKIKPEDLFSCPHPSIKALPPEADGTVFGECEACGDSSFLISEPSDWVIEAKQDLNNLHTLMQTIRFALSPEGGENGWRPPYGVDPLVDLALEVREQIELARKNRDKTLAAMEHTEAWYATRIRRLEDLCKQYGCWDQAASILANGTASPTEPRTYEQLLNVAQSRAVKAEANYAFMVERAANQHLEGYRELGARAAAAENEADRLRERLREVAQILIAEVGAEGPTDAEDAARKAVARMERLRELADEKAHEAGLYARRMDEAQRSRNVERASEDKIAAALHQELNNLFGWGDESMLHASLHVRNAVLNLRADLATERAETRRVTEKHDRLHERLMGIERANVDSWKNGYAAAERQIAAWLRKQGPVNHLWAAETIERGYYREEEPPWAAETIERGYYREEEPPWAAETIERGYYREEEP